MAKNAAVPKWQRSVVALSATVIAVVVVGTLYWAQAVFIPVGMAVFLAFLLTPLVRSLQRRGIGRALSVLIVVLGTAGAVTGGVWVVGRQLSELLTELPNYSSNIRDKIKSVRALSAGSARLEKMVEEISGDLKAPVIEKKRVEPNSEEEGTEAPKRPTEVVLQPQSPPWVGSLPGYIGSAMESVGNLALGILRSKLLAKKQAEREEELARLRGETVQASFGNAIRSYVLDDRMVKDVRTKHETPHVESVLNGDLDPFIEAYLRHKAATANSV